MDPHIFRVGDAPTPFTSDEIRGGCPSGRTIRLRIDTPGEEPVIKMIHFVEVDKEGATQESTTSPAGRPDQGTPVTTSSTWEEYQSHASFPRRATTIERELRDTPLGHLDCARYTVVDGDRTEVFWFDLGRPGMPVRVETYEAGEILSTMAMIEDTDH